MKTLQMQCARNVKDRVILHPLEDLWWSTERRSRSRHPISRRAETSFPEASSPDFSLGCAGQVLHQDPCKRIAAVAAAVAAVVAVAVALRAGAGRCAECSHCTGCSVFSPLPFLYCSPSASSARRWVCPTPPPSRASSAALLGARQTLRFPLALLMLDPSSVRIHHHVMCLFDTSLSSNDWFVSSSFPFSSTHSWSLFAPLLLRAPLWPISVQGRKCFGLCHGHARAVQPIHTIVLSIEDSSETWCFRSLVHLSHSVPCWS